MMGLVECYTKYVRPIITSSLAIIVSCINLLIHFNYYSIKDLGLGLYKYEEDLKKSIKEYRLKIQESRVFELRLR